MIEPGQWAGAVDICGNPGFAGRRDPKYLGKIFWLTVYAEPTNTIARNIWHSVLQVFPFHYDNALKLVMCTFADSQRGILYSASAHLGYLKEIMSLSCWECIGQIDVTNKQMNSIGHIPMATFAHSKVPKPFTLNKMQGIDETRNARPINFHLHFGTFGSILTTNALSIVNK